MSELFEGADLVHGYSRAEAVADGVLVDLSSHPVLAPLVKEAGFRFPLAMTAAAFSRYVALTPAAERAGNDLRGRAWDVLFMLFRAIRRELARNSDADTVLFEFFCVVDQPRPERCRLKAVIGPDDDGRPCFTVLLPDED